MHYDKAAVKKILMTQEHWPEWGADVEINDALPVIDARLQTVLDAYLADKTIDTNFNLQGVTTKYVMERYRCNFRVALMHMTNFIYHLDRVDEVTNPNYTSGRYFDVKPADAVDIE